MVRQSSRAEQLYDFLVPLTLLLCCANFIALAFYYSNTLPLQLLAFIGLAAFFLPGGNRAGAHTWLAAAYFTLSISLDYFYFTETSGFSIYRKSLYAFFAGAALAYVYRRKPGIFFPNYLAVGVLLSYLALALGAGLGLIPLHKIFTGQRFSFYGVQPNIYSVIPAFALVGALYTLLFAQNEPSGPPLAAARLPRLVRLLDRLPHCRPLLLAGALLAAVGVLLTNSRTTLAACGLTCLAMLWIAAKRRYGLARALLGLGLFCLAVAAGLAALSQSDNPLVRRFSQRISVVVLDPAADPTLQSRVPGWESALANIRARPWLGFGPEGYIQAHNAHILAHYAEYERRYGKNLLETDIRQFSHAHNQYLTVLVEQGVLGFVCLAVLVGWPLVYCLRRRTTLGTLLPLLCFLGLVSLADSPIHGNQIAACPATVLWMLLGYFSCLTAGGKSAGPERTPPPPPWPARLYGLLKKTARKTLPRRLRGKVLGKARSALFPLVLPVRHAPAATLAGVGFKPLAPGARVRGRPPAGPALPPQFTAERSFAEFGLLSVPEGGIYNQFILAADGSFIRETTTEAIRRKLGGGPARSRPLRRGAGEATALSNTYLDNYFHWFHDIVAGLLLLPDFRERRYCLPALYPYQLESLALLGLAPEQLDFCHPDCLVRYAQVQAFTAPEQGHPALIRSLAALPGLLPPPQREYPPRIYISRDDAAGRRQIVNERDLAALLARHGFRKMIFSRLPVREQLACLASAEAVIFPQGASVVNLAFCRPGTRVLEFYSPRCLITLGPLFAETLGLHYAALLGRDRNTSPDDLLSAYAMDLAQTEQLLREFFEQD